MKLTIYLMKSKNQLMRYYDELKHSLKGSEEVSDVKDGYTITLKKILVPTRDGITGIEIGYMMHIVNDDFEHESISREDFVYIDSDTDSIKDVVSFFGDGAKVHMHYNYDSKVKSEYSGYEYDNGGNTKDDESGYMSIYMINEHLEL